ncbi:hypothetical protein [Nocardioides sp. W7]|uniref:hypothetical protein n=1 Tax=Nocardioides sp. W7 TaxID=2931390 RepID=UPI001FD57D99|nr:hypothetical protein [Nocardioides sp. W7]
MQVTVDRDSVAMGDDTESHERVVDVPGETTLGTFLAHLSPGVSVAGGTGSWVIWIGDRRGDWVGMYADGEARVLRLADRTLAELGVTAVFFDYWSSAPPELLFASLAAGRLPDKTALRHEGWRQQWQVEDERAQEKEATTSKRLLTPDAVAAVAELGGRIEVHAPSYCRLAAADGTAYVVRSDQFWTRISRLDDEGDQHQIATFQPPGPLAETTLVAMLGTTWRELNDLPPVEPPRHRNEVRRSAGIWRWSWTERGELREGRYWPDGSLAAAFAPYARLGVPEITALFAEGAVR